MKKELAVVAAALAVSFAAEAFDKQGCRIAERFKDHPIFNTRHCSVNFGFLGPRGYFAKPETVAEVAKIKAAGANWVTLNTHFCQESFYSRKLFLDFERSSGEAELTDIVRELHRQGLHVLLKPCLMLLDGAWMGRVAFPDDDQLIQGVHNTYWADWFAALQGCLKYYAEFAERNGVEAMIIGAEYNGTTYQDERWRETIRKVREHYSGPLTYECADYEVANDDYTGVDAAKVKRLGWLEDLDFLALSTYPDGAPSCPREKRAELGPVSLETMKKHLAKRRTFVTALSAAYGRLPVLYTEIGTRSSRGNVCEPWNFMTESPYDAEEQANYMEAVFQTFSDLPFWMGLSWWKWDETQTNRSHYSTDPLKDRGFTVYGKPATKVLRKWSEAK